MAKDNYVIRFDYFVSRRNSCDRHMGRHEFHATDDNDALGKAPSEWAKVVAMGLEELKFTGLEGFSPVKWKP